MTNNLTVDDIRRVVDQYKDHDVTITTDGLGVYVANMANKQAIEVAKVLLDELERMEREYAEEREKMIKALKFYANEDNWRSGFVLGLAQADGGERAQTVLDEIGVKVE